jgi:glyoxylase-like metal-dependent hydrolase (beta-lactamase superfamily II)
MAFKKVYQGNMVEIYRVTDRVYFRKANLKKRYQCDGAFIVSDTGVAVVDAPPGGIEMAEEAEKLFHKPINALFLTHGHGDHAGGLQDFLERNKAGGFPLGFTIYCSRRLVETLEPEARDYRANFVAVDGVLTLNLSGGVEVELRTLGDVAHSKWDMFVRVPDPGILCTGDAVVEYETAFFHSADIESWRSILQKTAKEKGKWIRAGHGPAPFPYSYLGDFAAFLGVVEKAARDCLDRYNPNPKLTEKERFVEVSAEKVRKLVDGYFAEGGSDARFLEEKAGKEDARRDVRMVFWSLCRFFMR